MSRTARILIIEDNPTNLELMVYLLHAFGYDPRTAPDGERGIDMALREPPDLVVCDVQLPRIDGYGVVKHLKGIPHLASVPVIAVTALAMVGDRDRILGAGFDGYISKPIDPEQFVAEVEASLPPALRGDRQDARPTTRQENGLCLVPEGRHADILVVDDTPANRDYLRTVLSASGYTVRTAASVSEACTLAHGAPPDLVLSDLHMHPATGTELLARFKADPRLATVPVMILSLTSSHSRARDDCLAHGAERFLQLPAEPQYLLQEIANVLDGHA